MLKSFIKDMANYSPSQLLPALTAFITTPILTRLLPPAEYGNWALAASISAFLVALAVSGFGAAVIRFYPSYEAKSTLTTFFATISVSITAVIVIVAGISYPVLLFFEKKLPSSLRELLPLIILIFIVQGIYTGYLAILRAQKRIRAFTSFQLIISYGGLGTGLLFIMRFDMLAEGLLLGAFLIYLLALPFLIFLTTKDVGIHPRSFQTKDALQIWQYAWPLVLGNVAMWGLRLSDLFIIGIFKTERDMGLYTVSYNISSKSIQLLVSLFLLSVSPMIMNTWESKGQAATENALTIITRVYLILCLPAAVGLSVLAFPFVAILTAPVYHEGHKIVGLVVFSSFFWGLANIAMMGVAIKKQVRRLATNQIISALIHIGLAVLLVPYFGYKAAALTTLVGYIVLFVLHTLASQPNLSWIFPFDTLGKTCLSSVVMGLAVFGVYGLAGNAGGGSPLFLFLSILVAIPVYFGCLWGLGEIKKEEKNLILNMLFKGRGS